MQEIQFVEYPKANQFKRKKESDFLINNKCFVLLHTGTIHWSFNAAANKFGLAELICISRKPSSLTCRNDATTLLVLYVRKSIN